MRVTAITVTTMTTAAASKATTETDVRSEVIEDFLLEVDLLTLHVRLEVGRRNKGRHVIDLRINIR